MLVRPFLFSGAEILQSLGDALPPSHRSTIFVDAYSNRMRTLPVAIIVAAHCLRNPADTSARHFPPIHAR